MNSQRTFEHIQVQEIGDGVFAILPTESGYAGANAGVIALGDRTLIVDTLLTPAACRELLAAGQYVTGRQATVAVNTHYHSDHVWGNQACSDDMEIIASAGTRDLLLAAGAAEIDWYRQTAPAEIARVAGQLALLADNHTAAAERRRRRLETGQRFYRAALDAIDGFILRPPTLTFAQRIILHGSRRCVDIICCGAGHTGSDSVALVADADILFAGDLVTVGAHPYLPDGDLAGWQNALRQLEALHPKLIVPGHGAVGDARSLAEMQAYLTALAQLAADAATGGDHALAATPIPAAFAHWEFAAFFAQNLRFLCEHFRKALVL